LKKSGCDVFLITIGKNPIVRNENRRLKRGEPKQVSNKAVKEALDLTIYGKINLGTILAKIHIRTTPVIPYYRPPKTTR